MKNQRMRRAHGGMNEVNKTLFIPLAGKARVSRQKIILHDPFAEKIWKKEGFPVRGKSKSKWLAYNMAMRARVFDDWTERMLLKNRDALVLHVGCGLDSRCLRVRAPYREWIDCDLPDVTAVRKKYFPETERCHIVSLDASDPEQVGRLPDSETAIVVMEGLSMYLPQDRLRGFFCALQAKYRSLHILMDIYTEFGARASRYGNPVNEVGVTRLYGIDDIGSVTRGLRIRFVKEHSFTPKKLVEELRPSERVFFRLMFTGKLYRKFYRLVELEA